MGIIQYKIKYPRKQIVRNFVRVLGKFVLPLVFRIKIEGMENFPSSGPLILVANHTAWMETVMLAVYSPRLVEFIGSTDVPHEKVVAFFIKLFGVIPVQRGAVDRLALTSTLDVLQQEGVIGIFPEGGFWEPGRMRAQTGVSWISHRGHTPVLPIAVSGTQGAVKNALRLKRPRMTMKVGTLIPPCTIPEGTHRKTNYQHYSEKVMQAVQVLLPLEERSEEFDIQETFVTWFTIRDTSGNTVDLPEQLFPTHHQALAKLLHRPGILKIFRNNLKMPIEPLQQLHTQPPVADILRAVDPMLAYLQDMESGNPYLLTYRFGPKIADAMLTGLRELRSLCLWASENGYSILIQPVLTTLHPDTGEKSVHITQGEFNDFW